jgi:protein SCO1/2
VPECVIISSQAGLPMKFVLLLSAIFLFTCLATAQPPKSAAAKYFTDTVLVDQDRKEHRFYTDLVKDKAVIINVMFTTCKDSCPVMASNFQRIQESLGDRLGDDIHLLSISIDPETDTPSMLKAYSERFHAKPGWYFLSGRKENVDLVLKKLGLYEENKQNHLNLFLIGNDRTGLWKKAFGMSAAKDLLTVVDSVVNDGR